MIDAQIFSQPQLVSHCELSLSQSQRPTVGTDHKGLPVSAQSVWHFSPTLTKTGMWRRILVEILNTVKPVLSGTWTELKSVFSGKFSQS